ncbi:MAG: class 1 fructose-bisphosphatase, partial [Mesorhizobium sp.]
MPAATLDAFLNSYLGGPLDERRSAVVATVRQLTQAATKVRNAINQGVLGTAFGGTRGINADGDVQKDLDIFADEIFLDAMRHAPVALYASEELEQPVLLDRKAPLAVAIDPLDGSSNIDTNVSIGTIFSLLPATGAPDANPAASFLQAGVRML